jgi:hypothetical protein
MMAERKTGARAQSKDKPESKAGANTKSDDKAKGDTRFRAAGTTTRDKNESSSRGSAGSNPNERWQHAPAEDQKFLRQVGEKLSVSTKRAKWIGSPAEHPDHKGQSLATRNHNVIRRWAEERKAEPSTVPNTAHGDHLGVLRFNFPGYGGGNLLPVSWRSSST